ncbi:unnamed protein product [Sphenostylis stenocarpa]|uniref:Uncharacterized protein n=1 Tax=Sphenostylis stenocarpa TaxID=92480 RepID=A0AA86V6M9_9FABA|nr:unnamed protein product [Sphenostylis stenocarpa]
MFDNMIYRDNNSLVLEKKNQFNFTRILRRISNGDSGIASNEDLKFSRHLYEEEKQHIRISAKEIEMENGLSLSLRESEEPRFNRIGNPTSQFYLDVSKLGDKVILNTKGIATNVEANRAIETVEMMKKVTCERFLKQDMGISKRIRTTLFYDG